MGLLPNPWAYVNAWIPAVLWEYAAVLASKEQSHKPMTMNWRVEKASQSLNEVYLVSIPNIYVHTRMAFAVNCVAVELLIPSRSHVLGNEKQTRIWGSSYALPGLEHDIKVLTNNPFTGIKIRTSKICLKTPSVVLDTLTSLEVIGQTKGSNFGHRQSNSLERFCLNETVLGRCDQARTSPNFVNEYRYSGKSCAEQIKVLRRVHAQLDRCDEHQEAAIIGALSGCRHGLLVLDGPAGPGKTTTSAKCALCLTEIWKNVMVVMKSKIAADRIAEGIMLRFEKHGLETPMANNERLIIINIDSRDKKLESNLT
ncbi:AAA-19 domain containing protein [Pyrenophora tritici-repentis]|nr:AAA-19 domain containing protein [Pyrenophora tritici-repentis]